MISIVTRRALGASLVAALLAGPSAVPAVGEDPVAGLPQPPANGEMGFVVSHFSFAIVPGMDQCPGGTSPKLREAYLQTLAPAERDRLQREENKDEFERAWKLYAFDDTGANVCAQPDRFDHAMLTPVESSTAKGLDLDQGGSDNTCEHEEFTSPAGQGGIDNQEYRALGCTLEWRGKDGNGGEYDVGTKQFHNSGEWTQVILLRGVDSLKNDPEVEVIYANTPDAPTMDGEGNYLRGASFTVSTEAPRERNVLRGRIVDGVLLTDPAHIKLTQTWGQGGARDLRGNRSRWNYHEGRLRLAFQPDGSLEGLLAGYRPVFDVIMSPSLGSAGSALIAGIDCAAQLKTLRHYADGLKNPKTGKCEGVSSTIAVSAIPAFVNDAPTTRTASRSK